MRVTGLAERLDSRHTLVDGVLAGSGRCGMLSRASGRGCPSPNHHLGGCTLVTLVRLGAGASSRPSRSSNVARCRLDCVFGL